MKARKDNGRYDVRLSGSGGQGLVLAGVILAEALGIYEGKNVSQTQSYGPEARGGASRSDVVISDGEIFYPKSVELDLLLCLTQESCDQYFKNLKEDGILVVDSDKVRQLPTDQAYSLPVIRAARDEVGTPVVANVISLAAIVEISGICSRESLEKAVLGRAPFGTEEKNKLACKVGFELGRKAKENA
ncbi:MAG: 2-oxoacid:acceptor oxidoreductase family protein [candidate division Zixibacteria bacterium]